MNVRASISAKIYIENAWWQKLTLQRAFPNRPDKAHTPQQQQQATKRLLDPCFSPRNNIQQRSSSRFAALLRCVTTTMERQHRIIVNLAGISIETQWHLNLSVHRCSRSRRRRQRRQQYHRRNMEATNHHQSLAFLYTKAVGGEIESDSSLSL